MGDGVSQCNGQQASGCVYQPHSHRRDAKQPEVNGLPVDNERFYSVVYLEEDVSTTKQPHFQGGNTDIGLVVREARGYLVQGE